MPKRYRGPITRHIISRHIAPLVQTRMDSQSASRRQNPFAARRSKLEHYLGIEEHPTGSSSDHDTADSGSGAGLDNEADDRVHVDDIIDPARLRMYLKEALDIINKEGSSASETLKPLLDSRPDAASYRSLALREKIRQQHHTLAVKMHSETDMAPNHLYESLVKFLPEIMDIMQLPGDDTLAYAYMVLTELREVSFNLMNQLPNFAVQLEQMDPAPDEAYDELLAEVYRKRLANGLDSWQYESDLRIIKYQAKLFSVSGLTDWFPESQKILEEIVNESDSCSE